MVNRSNFPLVSASEVIESRAFRTSEYLSLFLTGQNPHLNPSRPDVYEPEVLRSLARDLQHNPQGISRFNLGRCNLSELNRFFTGLKAPIIQDYQSHHAVLNPRIHLPCDAYWGVPDLILLGEEVYSFIDMRMSEGKLRVPTNTEVLPTRVVKQTSLPGMEKDRDEYW